MVGPASVLVLLDQLSCESLSVLCENHTSFTNIKTTDAHLKKIKSFTPENNYAFYNLY